MHSFPHFVVQSSLCLPAAQLAIGMCFASQPWHDKQIEHALASTQRAAATAAAATAAAAGAAATAAAAGAAAAAAAAAAAEQVMQTRTQNLLSCGYLGC